MEWLDALPHECGEEPIAIEFRHAITIGDEDEQLSRHIALSGVERELVPGATLFRVALDQDDRAVAGVEEVRFKRWAAYGWPPDLPDDEVLERLLALNLERAPASA